MNERIKIEDLFKDERESSLPVNKEEGTADFEILMSKLEIIIKRTPSQKSPGLVRMMTNLMKLLNNVNILRLPKSTIKHIVSVHNE